MRQIEICNSKHNLYIFISEVVQLLHAEQKRQQSWKLLLLTMVIIYLQSEGIYYILDAFYLLTKNIALVHFLWAISLSVMAIVTISGIKKWSDSTAFSWHSFKWWHPPLIVLGLYLLAETQMLVPFTITQNQSAVNESVRQSIGTVRQYVTLFHICLAAPFAEEVIYRSAIMTTFRHSRYGADILFSALTFTLIHVSTSQNLWQEIWIYLPFGFILAILYRITNSFYPAFFLHIWWNTLGMRYLIRAIYLYVIWH